jgi:hypothetical protein
MELINCLITAKIDEAPHKFDEDLSQTGSHRAAMHYASSEYKQFVVP